MPISCRLAARVGKNNFGAMLLFALHELLACTPDCGQPFCSFVCTAWWEVCTYLSVDVGIILTPCSSELRSHSPFISSAALVMCVFVALAVFAYGIDSDNFFIRCEGRQRGLWRSKGKKGAARV